MTSHLRASLLVVLALLTFAPATPLAQEVVPVRDAARSPHAWKLAYAKRLAEERMEHREKREKREAALRKAAKEGRKVVRKRSGARARPAPPSSAPVTLSERTSSRGVRPWNSSLAPPPTNVLVNDKTGDGTVSGQCETSIVGFGDHLVAAWNDGQGFPSGDTQGWATSTDGGLTWTDQGTFAHPPGVSNFVWTSDPVLAVNEKTGAFYFSALCDLSVGAAPRSGIAVVKGRWNGNSFSWGTPVVMRHVVDDDFNGLDKQWIVADSVSDRVYVSYSNFVAGLSEIDFQWADSALAAFSAPQQISLNIDTENGWVQGSRPAVDGDGLLYVMYYLIGQLEADYYRVRLSTNNGVSFAPAVTAASIFTNFGTGAPGFNREIGVQFAGFAVDRSHGPNRGRLYLAWPESINWLDDVNALGQSGSKSEVEPNNTIANATPALVGQTLRGSLSSASDDDLFAISLTAGQHIVVAADSIQTPGNVFRLRLAAGDGTTMLTHTECDATVNSVPSGWPFTAPHNGIYYVRVTSKFGSGSYRLRTGFADRNGERGRDQRDIFASSSDNGVTWTTPIRLNEDPVGFDNWLPEVTVAPDGGLYSAWYDFHDAPLSTNGGQSSVYLARSGDGGVTWTTLGAVTDAMSAWPPNSSNIIPNQGDYISLFAGTSYVWPCWADMRLGDPDVFTARVPLIPLGTQVAFEAVRLGSGSVSIDWQATPADTVTMRLYRATDGGAYQYLDLVYFDTGGQATFTDTTVVGNHGYSYRLGKFVNGVEIFHGQVSVFLPLVFPLSLSPPRPNPVVGGSFGVSFSLATNDPAELLLHDISGREVFRRSLTLGQGPHTLTLPVGSGLNQGLYVLTLRQAGRNTSTRFHLVR